MTKKKAPARRRRWGKSKWCRAANHGWCANRTSEESHCTCTCHSFTVTYAAIALSGKFPTLTISLRNGIGEVRDQVFKIGRRP